MTRLRFDRDGFRRELPGSLLKLVVYIAIGYFIAGWMRG